MEHTITGSPETVGEAEIYKLRLNGKYGVTIALPKTVCLALGMEPGGAYVAVRAVGPCLVISKATDVSSEDSRTADADAELERAFTAWQQRHASKEKS